MNTTNKNILIYRIGSLGDTVIALPAFHKVRQSFPDAVLTLLTNRPVSSKAAPLESILGNEGYFFNSSLDYPIGSRNPFLFIYLILKIRSLKIKTLVYLTPARSRKVVQRDAFFFRCAGIKNIIGLPELEEDFTSVIDKSTGVFEWEAMRLTRRLNVLGSVDLRDLTNWDLKLSQQELQEAKDILPTDFQNASIIALSVGTKCQSKDWEKKNWIHLMQRLKSAYPFAKVMMIGSKEDYELSQECIEVFGKESGLNCCGKTSPRVSAALLKYADLFIGNDSGPMHLAASVGVRCIGIFASIDYEGKWYPAGTNNYLIYHKVDCAVCKLTTCIVENKKCILSITVDEVMDGVHSIYQK